MRMDEGLDTGPMIAQGVIPIRADDTTGTLTARLAELGARMAVEVLRTGSQVTLPHNRKQSRTRRSAQAQ